MKIPLKKPPHIPGPITMNEPSSIAVLVEPKPIMSTCTDYDQSLQKTVIDAPVLHVKEHVNYILYSNFPKYANCTYVGYSNDVRNRIRKHRCEIKGGAKYTTRRSPDADWEFLIIIRSQNFDRITGLSSEWHVMHPDCCRKRKVKFNSPKARLDSLHMVINHAKFITFSYVFHVAPAFYEYAQSIFKDMARVTLVEL